ncbi:MAG: DNA ligase D [Gemmatimonadetes bacterium]|nr:DNA ligase D [Gemmatimonadota bacterium]
MPPKKKSTRADALRAYREKRSLERTPEPAGAVATAPGRLFVVHKHAARQLHYDLRLELDGVLRSWAVPKGPSRDPAEKRLAVHVEDHPVEYGDFEGLIPEGNYGAGATIVWDRGAWVPIGDPAEGLKTGKLLFELRGYKLRGKWTLVKIKKSERDWLLIKERDGLASREGDAFPESSVLSGLTVEDLAGGRTPADTMRAELQRGRAPRRQVQLAGLEPMLAETRERPFTRAGWLFELKYDGYRILAARTHGEASLRTRNGRDITAVFPDVARAVAALPFDHIVIDGEVVVHDDAGIPSFQRLQQRALLTKPADVRRAAAELPASLYVFDLLGFEEYDVRPLPLVERKRLLRLALPQIGALRYSDHVEEQGEAFFEQVAHMGLEGVIAKKADAPYRSGRSPNWLKLKADRSDDFVVVGYTAAQGSRTGFGALHLAAYDAGVLRYAGRVGTGFDDRLLRELRSALDGRRRRKPACEGAPAGGEHAWAAPELVAEVRYREWTDEGFLRHPVFLRLREDKKPEECVRRGAVVDLETAGVGVGERAGVGKAGNKRARDVDFTNLDKVFWPAEKYTKGELIEYYRAVAPWLLPYLKDRPLVMTRFPDGIEGKSFFQKDAPQFAPEWLRRERVWSEDSQRELSYFVCDDAAALLYIINLGTIPLHVWASRVPTLECPDWCILDLDPKGAPFTDVVKVARALRALCEEIELPCFAKTSGSSGLHVLVPLARQCTHEQARLLGQLLANVVVRRLPEIATMTRVISQREGKVYLDYLQNGQGKLLVAPFSARPVPGALVSTPLDWKEVTARLDFRHFTIESVPKRMQKRREDPMAGLLEARPDLVSALARLQGKL